MSRHSCKVTSLVNGRTSLITVDGCLDKNAPNPAEVVQQAVQSSTRIAILDLSHTPLLNSEGLEWLDRIRSELEPRGVRIRVVAPAGGKVQRILKLMQYDKVVTLLHSLRDALRAGKRRYLRLRAKTGSGDRRSRPLTGRG